jgi:hypothetical protein
MPIRILLLWFALVTAALAQAPGDALRAMPLLPGETIRLDGRLDHPAWARAPAYEGFVEKDPDNGAAPPQRTRVQLLFDGAALYVGVTAFDTDPAQIRAPLVRHDQVLRTQDFVVVYIDAIGSRRSAQFFRVNAAGSLGDGMHTAADDSEDFAPDFDWDAATQRTPEGWTAVLRLPFASLRFSEDPAATWRIQVARRLPRQQFHLVTSVPIPRGLPSFIAAMQPLEGVRLPERHHFLSLRPSLTLRHDDGGSHAEASLDAKWRASAELVVDATLNPDFSQVALDVPQLSGNERFALFLSEKRPFFFEASDLLRSPTEALYTRSLAAPRAGLRATWRGAGLAGTLLALDDRGGGLLLLPGPYGTGVTGQPASRVLAGRAQADRGTLQGSLLLASRRYEGADGADLGDNLVLGPDLDWRIAERWRLRAQWLRSRTRALDDGAGGLQRGPAVDGDRAYAKLFYNRGRSEASLSVDDIGAGFRDDAGFVDQAGVRGWTAYGAQGWAGVMGLNEFWVNTEASQVTDRRSGQVIERRIQPGLWVAGARNLEAWLEWHADSRQRLAADGPLLAERYWDAGLVLTPARWWHFAEFSASVGRFADAVEGVVRPGHRLYVFSRLRPWPRLELEPSWREARLTGEGRAPYRETAAQLLAVWHLGPRTHLRAIAQRSTLARGVTTEPATSTVSLTWNHRRSSGTVVYVGATEARDGGPGRRELFVKLQVDTAEALEVF